MSTPAVKPIPEGMHSLTPHLVCDGAAAAIDFYKKAFGATEKLRLADPKLGGAIVCAELVIGDSVVSIADEAPQWNARGPKALGGSPASLWLYLDDCDAAFNRAVAAGATVMMPPMDMFWGDRFAGVFDPFGYRWSLATHTQDLTPEEIAAGEAAWRKQMEAQGPAPK